MNNKPKATLLVGIALVVATMGLAIVAAPAAAHGNVDEHCWTDSHPDDPYIDDCNDDDQNDKTASLGGTWEAPPIEGPGDPDGSGDIFPYIFQAVIFTQCTPGSFGPVEDIPSTCVTTGGDTWNGCDANAHWNLGGNPAGDAPCSWDRGVWTADDDDAVVGNTSNNIKPFNSVTATLDCLTCSLPDRTIPFVFATDSNDADTFYGEGVGPNAANDGDCTGTTVGDLWNTLGVTPPLFGCNDSERGPREIEAVGCNRVEVTHTQHRPNDQYGEGEGIWQQALGENQYLTHDLGPDNSSVDPDFDHYQDHPGVQGAAIFLLGTLHGGQACPDADPVPTARGTFSLEAF